MASPASALMIVLLPTPDEPINAAVRPGRRYWRTDSRPCPDTALTECTSAPGTTRSTRARTASTSGQRSALLKSTTGCAPLPHTTARYRSMRRRLNSWLSEVTTKTVSRFVARICSSAVRPASFRERIVRRGRIARMVARLSAGRGATTTQSPTAGKSSRSSAR